MRSVRHARKTSILVAAGMLAVAASACSSGSGSSGASGDTRLKILVSPQPNVAPIYIAKEKGLFAKQGLDVTVAAGQSGSSIVAALQSGGVNIGMVNYVTVFSGVSHGLKLKFVAQSRAGQAGADGIFTRKGSAIRSMAGLRGKKIGVPGTGSIADLVTDLRLAEAGIGPKDVRFVQVPVPNALSSLNNGQVDASWLTGTQESQARSAGNPRIIDAWAGSAAGFPIAGWAGTGAWINSHRDTVTKFKAALKEASQLAQRDPGLVRRTLPTFMHLTPSQASSIAIPTTWQTDNDPTAMKHVSDTMTRLGFLDKPIRPQDVLAQ
ncbi:ABC transporter substrate-binding protein [Actinomadura opuntiae]|uniref:ABC transporter substrate-binding protein n=1 Tax=Actinomadura sp. OS1-43 TaxID=604315 RepID=UPI00255B1FBF|nr:ABC transporter substrate-binding protein [Actinomadura sp. OS1-43]MDL4814072.1 ABC transporter substrate-binding protein [Actinomadura sp. OS1-43]